MVDSTGADGWVGVSVGFGSVVTVASGMLVPVGAVVGVLVTAGVGTTVASLAHATNTRNAPAKNKDTTDGFISFSMK